MMQATVAIYPFQQTGYDAVHHALAALRRAEVQVEVSTMHNTIVGSPTAIFQA